MGMPLSMPLAGFLSLAGNFCTKQLKTCGSKIVDFLTQESHKLPIYTLSAANLCIRDSRKLAAPLW